MVLDDAALKANVERLWAATGVNRGGFGEVADFSAAPDLYRSAWNMLLAEAYKLDLGYLDRSQMRAWLMADLGTQSDGLPRLETDWLVARSLHALGIQLPSDAFSSELEVSRRGSGYAFGNAQSTLSATETAVEIASLAQVRLPDLIAADLTARLGSPPATDQPQAWLEDFLPLWQSADRLVSRGVRDKHSTELGPVLRRMWATLTSRQTLDPTSLGVLASAKEVASANGITLDAAPANFVAALRADDGNGLVPMGGSGPDAHGTYYAALLGRPLPEVLAPRLRAAATPAGWPSGIGAPSPQSSLYGLLVERSLGSGVHESELRAQTAAWLPMVDVANVADPSNDPQPAFYTLALCRLLGVPLDASRRELISVLDRVAPSMPAGRLVWLLRMADVLGVVLSTDQVQPLRTAVVQWQVRSERDVLDLWIAGRYLNDQTVIARAEAANATYAFGPDYRHTLRVPGPDLLSTAIGLQIAHAGSPAREAAVKPFARSDAFSMLPAVIDRGNQTNLESSYLGLLALARIADPSGLF